MKKIPLPNFDFDLSLNTCIQGVGSAVQVGRYNANLFPCGATETDYTTKARQGDLFTFPSTPHVRGQDPVVHGTLVKSELTKLYTDYFVPADKPARALYEKLKVTANGKCPFCGGIGHVRTLDHYMPKANFPLFSVLPGNLVPCCRDCNTEKLNSFANTKGEQPLHPYYDNDKYFNEQWVFADVIETDPPSLHFYAAPPVGWAADEQERVQTHFREYGLGEKFGTEAAADLPESIQTRRTTLRNATPDEFSDYLMEKSATLDFPTNNWRRVMFASLSASAWFCSNPF